MQKGRAKTQRGAGSWRSPFRDRANGGESPSPRISCDHERPMPTATITVDSNLKARLAELANEAGQSVDDFVGALLRRIADADVHFERGVPVFPPRLGAPVLTVEDVDRLANGEEEQSGEGRP